MNGYWFNDQQNYMMIKFWSKIINMMSQDNLLSVWYEGLEEEVCYLPKKKKKRRCVNSTLVHLIIVKSATISHLDTTNNPMPLLHAKRKMTKYPTSS